MGGRRTKRVNAPSHHPTCVKVLESKLTVVHVDEERGESSRKRKAGGEEVVVKTEDH